MKKPFRLFLIIFILSLCLTGCVFSDKEDLIRRTNPKPTEEIDSVYVLSSNGYQSEWKIKAEKVDRFPDKRMWIGYEVRFETLKQNEEKSVIVCKEAVIDEIANTITGKGNVILESPKGFLKTELLIFNRFSNEVNAPGYVYLKRGGNVMEGYGLITNTSFDYINMKQVKGHGNPKKEDFN